MLAQAGFFPEQVSTETFEQEVTGLDPTYWNVPPVGADITPGSSTAPGHASGD